MEPSMRYCWNIYIYTHILLLQPAIPSGEIAGQDFCTVDGVLINNQLIVAVPNLH